MAPSCFKIISCGGSNEAVDRDGIDASPENKSPDKRGWSFRKRSGRHRVLSNTVVTEKVTSSDSKPVAEPISIGSEPQVISNISEKTSDNIWTEEGSDLVTKNGEVAAVAAKSVCEEEDMKCEAASDGYDESAVIVIQAAVRRFLAERQLVKHKNVVKLQAAVRGHLVRSHAVGTLRCVQAIVKMQALVRARIEKGVQDAGINSKPTYVSIEKLLSNKLARQLLETTPKTKPINIKCDPSKSDSAWNWLERWMSVSSPDDHVEDKVVNNSENEAETFTPSNVTSHEEKPITDEPMDLNTKSQIEVSIPENQVSEPEPIPEIPILEKNPVPENPVSETKPIPEYPVSKTKPESEPIPEIPILETKPIPENLVSKTKPIHENPVSEPKPIPDNPVSETKPIPENPIPEPKPIPENQESEPKPKPIPENPVSETEPKRTGKRVATDQPDSDGRKTAFGSRKASNPAFIAAQSRFEELTSLTKPFKPTHSSNQDDGSGSFNQDDVADSYVTTSAPEKVTHVPNIEPDEHLVSHGPTVVQNGGSECGTELSITSTLDSPDPLEVESNKPEEPKALNEAVGDIIIINNNNNNINIELEPEREPEPGPAPEVSVPGSPRSHITVPESQGTPSSQVSTSTKKSKSERKSTSQKRKSWSTSKKSTADSGLRSSLEQLPKDPKPGKRRNSFGSPKPDNTDHELQSVPSYMQATESARLKAIANGNGNSSPGLSPDVNDKESYLKKRPSLPGAVNGRQGSPRIQRSMSQALQTAKGNGNQERKWQR